MGIFLRILILCLGGIFTLTVIYLLMKKKINEKVSLLWLVGSFAVLIFSFIPLVLDKIAEFVGVNYPPTLLFMFSTIVLLFICLMHSVQISVLNTEIKELTQQFLIKSYEDEDKTNVSQNDN